MIVIMFQSKKYDYVFLVRINPINIIIGPMIVLINKLMLQIATKIKNKPKIHSNIGNMV